jgi:hypothetical protein
MFNRAVSLSNLLDQRPQPPDGPLGASGGGGGGPPGGGGAPAGGSSGGGADDGGGDGGARRRVRSAPQWTHKQTVIEMLNELIDELEGIEAQIAHQAVEHIHANEVRRAARGARRAARGARRAARGARGRGGLAERARGRGAWCSCRRGAAPGAAALSAPAHTRFDASPPPHPTTPPPPPPTPHRSS